MAQVLVFVDDAVQGDLPEVCVIDGVATSDGLRLSQEVGARAGLGVAWLLLLAGPLGWLGLLVLSVARSGRGEVLIIQVPFSEPAYQRLREARRLRRIATAVAAVAGAVFFLLVTAGGGPLTMVEAAIAVAIAIAAIAILIVAERCMHATQIRIDLDGSRRWITLTDVHPNFAAAHQSQAKRQHA